jgi:beta-glucosidase/6-phospho-beta-glucosidase/beta-galactosidase
MICTAGLPHFLLLVIEEPDPQGTNLIIQLDHWSGVITTKNNHVTKDLRALSPLTHRTAGLPHFHFLFEEPDPQGIDLTIQLYHWSGVILL